MTPSRLAPPEPVDLVPADEVSELIAAADRDLTELELRVEQATAAADEAEGWVRESGVDEQASTWTLVRLQRFVTDLREEADRDAHDVIEVATHRAALRHSQAQAEIARLDRKPADDGSAGPFTIEMPFAVAPYRIGVPPVPEPAPAQDAADIAAAPVMFVAPVAPDAPATPVAPVGFLPGANVDEELHEAAAVAAAAAPVAVVDPLVEPAPAPAVAEAPPSAPGHGGAETADFWPPEPATTARQRRFRLPLSAILEVAAVVLILVFILLRLS